jgi:hypothetical protein
MYFSTIGEANTAQVVLPKPSQQRPISQSPQPHQPTRQQQPTTQVIQPQPSQVQQTPQMQQQNQQQPASNRLNAAAMNKRQIPNGSKNTVNALRQAQQPLNIRK